MLFINSKQGFHIINMEKITNVLEDFLMPQMLIKLIKLIMKKYLTSDFDGKTSRAFEVTMGVHQRDSLSVTFQCSNIIAEIERNVCAHVKTSNW